MTNCVLRVMYVDCIADMATWGMGSCAESASLTCCIPDRSSSSVKTPCITSQRDAWQWASEYSRTLDFPGALVWDFPVFLFLSVQWGCNCKWDFWNVLFPCMCPPFLYFMKGLSTLYIGRVKMLIESSSFREGNSVMVINSYFWHL